MLSDFYKPGALPISFELFPPKTDKGVRSLMLQVEQLVKHKPAFITCTYGAGGSTRGRTLEIVEKVKTMFQVPVAAHLTVVGSSVADLRSFLAEAERRGVDYIVALRGDPPQGETTFKPNPKGLRYANELVELINDEFSELGVLVAGYPEKHVEAPSAEVDLENLKRKVDAGAQVIVSQLFFRNSDFYSWRERCEKAGITVPIVPGIFPINSLAQISKIAKMCGAGIPKQLFDKLSEKPDDAQWHKQVGTAYASQQVNDLLDNGVPGFHFYVLNQAEATGKILTALKGHQAKKKSGSPA
ncbi:methylenetetrahydrofolate reductase [NAD(P)H] [Blastopirellula marina]|uniref:Methylenetetrahydrofolate reductase n=1 Tax=Blastopirellula marina TaxID=124 RepID=A0A2S8F3P3_9BACT|nr:MULTISPECIES: methylenetetrahydrofolate reductase [NAD(P)H] [Pirellulaceae]PQO26771.1 methylenetetrahydrofolate reductase [NAD(P)H] [Blastopirellula marina]RCS46250.1 methylenetetrahydrofolate reductase [NAD(P)H] [Bremerella cremea]